MKFILFFCTLYLHATVTTYDDLIEKNLIHQGETPALHLGCGETHINGYINIDFPMENRPLHKKETADYYSDITKLTFPPGAIKAIENHHIFEHFSRPISIALLCAWHYWLTDGGELVIETPDFAHGIQRYLKTKSFEEKQIIIRHLFGSQEAPWALHWDGWSEDKFRHFLTELGFDIISINCSSWNCIDNILVISKKQSSKTIAELQIIGKKLLKLSMVNASESEVLMWEGWCKDFEEALFQMAPS